MALESGGIYRWLWRVWASPGVGASPGGFGESGHHQEWGHHHGLWRVGA